MMVEKLQNLFHTETWWGKTIFIVLIYSIFWCIFYGVSLVIPHSFYQELNNFFGFLFALYWFLIIPYLSFFIPKFLLKLFTINKLTLYFIHYVLLLISITLFIYFGILISSQSWFNF